MDKGRQASQSYSSGLWPQHPPRRLATTGRHSAPLSDSRQHLATLSTQGQGRHREHAHRRPDHRCRHRPRRRPRRIDKPGMPRVFGHQRPPRCERVAQRSMSVVGAGCRSSLVGLGQYRTAGLLYFPVVLRPTLDAAHTTMVSILEMGDEPVVSSRGIFSADQRRCLRRASVSL